MFLGPQTCFNVYFNHLTHIYGRTDVKTRNYQKKIVFSKKNGVFVAEGRVSAPEGGSHSAPLLPGLCPVHILNLENKFIYRIYLMSVYAE